MARSLILQLLDLLGKMTDEQLYEAGKIVTHMTGLRHATRVIEGKEVRPGKRGVRWKKAEVRRG